MTDDETARALAIERVTEIIGMAAASLAEQQSEPCRQRHRDMARGMLLAIAPLIAAQHQESVDAAVSAEREACAQLAEQQLAFCFAPGVNPPGSVAFADLLRGRDTGGAG